MIYLFSVVLSFILFGGFLALTAYETKRGERFFAPRRRMIDGEAERFAYAVSHIDLAAFVRTGLRALIARLAHDIAHGSLIAVRSVEKLLTRAVRALRIHHASTAISASANPSSDFVATMKDFKEELRSGRKTEEATGDIIADRE